jgi:hypothetical protein
MRTGFNLIQFSVSAVRSARAARGRRSFKVIYSYLSATIGSTLVARLAGI